VLGTAEYLDPEVAAGADPDATTDVYGLGIVCYEALAGRPPYQEASPAATLRAAAAGQSVPLRDAAPDVPGPLAEVVERAISRHCGDRYQSAAELADALRRAAVGEAGEAGRAERPTANFGPRPPRPAAPPRPGTPRPARPSRVGAARTRPSPSAAVDRLVRPAMVIGTVALIAVLAVAGWLMLRRGPGHPVARPEAGHAELAPKPDPPPCSDAVAPSPPRPPGTVLVADIDGSGCGSYAVWADGVLTVPARSGRAAATYQLGEPGDQVVLGDWDCDGRATPGLFRPASGDAYVFDGWAGPGQEMAARPVDLGADSEPGQGRQGGAMVRVAHSTQPDHAGCDKLDVIAG